MTTPQDIRAAAAQASMEAMGYEHEGYMVAWLCTHLAAAMPGTSSGFLRLSDQPEASGNETAPERPHL